MSIKYNRSSRGIKSLKMAINRLANKNILLIGGTSGIGFATAEAALANGANITISSSSKEKVARALERLRESNPSRCSAIRTYVADLSTKEKLDTTIEALLEFTTEISPIDHIVFTAGNIPPLASLPEASFVDLEAFMTVRVYGAIAIGKHAPKYMAIGKESSITLTSGTQARKPSHWLPPVVAGAVEGLMKGLAVTLSPVRVNVVSPGRIITELLDRIPKEMLKQQSEKAKDLSLTKDVGYPADTAEAYLYLMKDYFATGSVVTTNGGVLLV
jgi:NAD(P)-dependent dehydrogenase (short-subunit alcohol dehydrogenase family)